MKKLIIVIRIILIIAVVGTLAFIWSNSVKNQTESSEQSSGVYEVVKPTLDVVFGENKVTKSEFRKTAHFSEFMLLGLETSLLIISFFGADFKYFFFGTPFGFTVAGIDEFIQHFSGRGPSFWDVLIDTGGFSLSVLAVAVVIGVFSSLKLNKKSPDNH